jgi:malonyl-CoA O-methyltransferase
MNVVQEFSRFAEQYNSYNIIQKRVAKRLISMVKKADYTNIFDIGSGSGALYEELKKRDINFKTFWALDFSKEMLSIHPDNSIIKKEHFNFNSQEYFSKLPSSATNLILSSSALQWSQDLDFTLRQISRLGSQFYFSLFTSKTFSTLHQVAKITSPIYPESYIIEVLDRYYHYKRTKLSYRLQFDNTRQMLQYIKRSGVGGGKRQLSYREIKYLMKNYPYDYLEFEVLFIEATQKVEGNQ